jgi:hypothetical protein
MMVEGRDALLAALLYTARTGVLIFVLEHSSENQTDGIKFKELPKVDELAKCVSLERKTSMLTECSA